MKTINAFELFLAIRMASIWIIQSYYVPDEFWQSLEVAHKISFGYGYLTWEWVHGLRSYLYPSVIAALFKILQLIGLDRVELLILIPRLFQATLSAYSDLRFYIWTGKQKWSVFNIIVAWFWFYTGSRTIINTVETSLTVIALSYFPWVGTSKKGSANFLWIVALMTTMRPTAAIPWIPLCTYYHLIYKESVKDILKRYIIIGFTVLSLSILIDSYFHGEFVVTVWKFFEFNILNDIGSWYGVQPWYWYLSTGFPAILGIHLLPFMVGAIQCVYYKQIFSTNFILLITILFTIVVYSFIPHKEFRFILPLLPMALFIGSNIISRWSRNANNILLWFIAFVLFASNIIPTYYLGMVHQRGSVEIMRPLSNISKSDPNNTSILFLLPCHSTPLYSHLHVNVTTRFLTCEPNFAKVDGYVDEADKFYENPNTWLQSHYTFNGDLPTHIVTFDVLVPKISSILSRYRPIVRQFHTKIKLNSRIGEYIIIHELVN